VLVDLAGSERAKKTGITGGQGMEEAKNINKSLTSLGLVIKVRVNSYRGSTPSSYLPPKPASTS
jgi:hypothetical protein